MKECRIFYSLEDLPDSYSRLFVTGISSTSFFSSMPWFQNLLLTSLSQEHTVRFYGVEDNGIPCLLLPMCFRTSTSAWYEPRHLLAASNYYSSLFNIIQTNSSDHFQDDLDFLIRYIANERPRWDRVDLHPMALESPQYIGFEQAFRRAGLTVQRYFCFGNWYLQVNGRCFQEYFDSLPSRLKNTIHRKRKQLEKNHGLTISLVQSEQELDLAIAAYEQVYHSSWKLPEAYPLFISGLIRTCASQGSLRLGIAYVAERPVAAQLWVVHKQIASIYKLAYDETYAHFSVGSVLTSSMMQHVIDIDHVTEIDYLTGDDVYKQDWMSDRRERWGLIAFNLGSVHGMASACWHIGRRILKSSFSNVMLIIKRPMN